MTRGVEGENLFSPLAVLVIVAEIGTEGESCRFYPFDLLLEHIGRTL